MAKEDKRIILGVGRGGTEPNSFSSVHAPLPLLQQRKLISKWSKLAKLNRWKPWVMSHHFINASRMTAIEQNTTRRIKKFKKTHKLVLFYIDR